MKQTTLAEMIDLLAKHTINGLFTQDQYNSLESLIIESYLTGNGK